MKPKACEGPTGHLAGEARDDPWAPVMPTWWSSLAEYWIDAAQRSILFWDVLRERGDRYHEHAAKVAPHVLKFGLEIVMDGRELPRPVNYLLVRVAPPKGTVIDARKRPFVVVDPRAGHGPGIGGFKPQSEIGVAFKAGHPCYFIGFLPEPVSGQTIGDIAAAEAQFLERVIALHPDADGKPAVIGNCQAGWAVMIVAALRPELFGPIIVAGSPLSYWAGTRGQNPMRYTGGLLGGSWLTALTGDLGHGKFDGAWLVTNFESLNPANTLWTKQYNLYANIDTEPPRYLEFEQWWGGHVLLNAEEMQEIVDTLFVGNTLSTARMVTKDGQRVDFRGIRSPIVVFCSRGDNITPPPQALGWIRDLYGSVDEIRAHGQTIVYTVHEKIGHLGIFVSASVAKKEHDEFASNIDLIDVLPPGLYEAVITQREGAAAEAEEPDYIGGEHLVRFEERSIADIVALCGDGEDERKAFSAVARFSDVNLGIYRAFARPWIEALANDASADWMRRLHPVRLQYDLLSSENPLMKPVPMLANAVRQMRRPVDKENPYWQMQEWASSWIEQSLDAYRDFRDLWSEAIFNSVYGSPLIQTLAGLNASDTLPRRAPGEDPTYRALLEARKAALAARIEEGGACEGMIRALLYMRRPEGAVDERSFRYLDAVRHQAAADRSLADFKTLVREQFFMLVLDEGAAVAAIPQLLARDRKLATTLRRVLDDLSDIVPLQASTSKAREAEIHRMLESVLGDAELRAEKQDTKHEGRTAARATASHGEVVRTAKR